MKFKILLGLVLVSIAFNIYLLASIGSLESQYQTLRGDAIRWYDTAEHVMSVNEKLRAYITEVTGDPNFVDVVLLEPSL